MQEITKRVLQAKESQGNESVLAAHLDAIADVYDTDRETVEAIARKVLAEQSDMVGQSFDLKKITNIAWVSALVLIMISVLWLLYQNTQVADRGAHTTEAKAQQKVVEYVSEALAAVNVLKISVAEHHQTYMALPTELAALGVLESELVLNKYIDRMEFTEDATIVMHLSALIGKRYYIKLRPVARIASSALEWECSTNLAQGVVDEIDGCTKQP